MTTKPVAYVLRDDLEDDWTVRELADKIENATVEDFALVIRVLACRMAVQVDAEEAERSKRSRDAISFLGDLGKACDSIAAAVCPELRQLTDAEVDPQGVEHVESTLAALRAAADGLAEVAEGWI